MWSAILSIVASVAKFFTKRNEDKNAPDVKAAAKANQENANVEKETKAVKDKDVSSIQNNLSE